MNVSVREDNGKFVGSADGVEITLQVGDAREHPTPMEAVLMSAGACSLLDVASILSKRRIEHEDLRVDISATRRDMDPRVFTSIHLIYSSSAPEMEMERAVRLSVSRYCSVLCMLSKTAKVTWEVRSNIRHE